MSYHGKPRQVSKGSSGTLQALPGCCCARALSYLELGEVALVAQCSLLSEVRAYAPELWLLLCEGQWPAVASSEALRRAVLRRHPRDCFIHTYLEHALPRPLLDLDDHLVHLEVRQKGRSICSVAREARDVFRSGVTEHTAWSCAFGGYVAPDGILFENISARVDCSDDDTFPPEAAPVSTKYFVIRKSDGHMAVLSSDDRFGEQAGGAPIGVGTFECYSQYPSLTGVLPMNCYCVNRLQPKNLRTREQHRCSSLGWHDTRKGDNYFEVSTTLTVGTNADGAPNERLPAPTGPPTVVVTEGQVEIRSIFTEFSGDLYRDEPEGTREMEEYHISSDDLGLEAIRSVAQHLRFG